MENAIIIYLLKVSLAVTIFYGIYMLCMRNDTFLRLRRFYLLSSIIVSLVYPSFSIELSPDAVSRIPALITDMLGLTDAQSEGAVHVEVGAGYATFDTIPITETAAPTFGGEDVILMLLLFIAGILFLRFAIQCLSILMMRVQNVSEKRGLYRIIKIDGKGESSFSFFHWIFISSKDIDKDKKGVLTHEMLHARQLHSFDIMLSEIFSIVLWWNPVAWLLRREVKINLEYLADKGVLDCGYNAKEYQYLLLQTVSMNTGISIINNFNVSQLKKRITMINKRKTSILFSAKYLLLLPIVAALLLTNAVKASDETKKMTDARIVEDIYQDQKPFVTVEQMPSYQGGESAMRTFIKDNLKYPTVAFEKGLQGRVTVRFVVDKDGTVKDVKIIRGVSPECDKEAERVVALMPKWNPGKQNGIAVPVYYTLPVIFKINEKREDIKTLEPPIIDITSDPESETETPAPRKTFLKVDQMPSFPGGELAMMDYIMQNLKYPIESQKKGVQGRVTIRFIVDQDGFIKEPTLIRGIDAACDKEAMRVVEDMPKWIPGKQNGQNVPVYFTIPIVFRLTKKGNEKIVTATYPGGKDAFNRFFAQNLKYPSNAQKAKEVGLVIVKAVILKTGKIGAVSVDKSVAAALDNEVVRVVKSMPQWTPETINGEVVDTQVSIPVVFRLKTKNGTISKDAPDNLSDNVIVVVGYAD